MRLDRSHTDRVIAGVCGGLGDYLGINSAIVRIAFVALALSGGQSLGVLTYGLLWIIMPPQALEQTATDEATSDRLSPLLRPALNPQTGLIVGAVLIVLGGLWLMENLIDLFNLTWLFWLRANVLWPLVLIIGGGALLWRTLQER